MIFYKILVEVKGNNIEILSYEKIHDEILFRFLKLDKNGVFVYNSSTIKNVVYISMKHLDCIKSEIIQIICDKFLVILREDKINEIL